MKNPEKNNNNSVKRMRLTSFPKIEEQLHAWLDSMETEEVIKISETCIREEALKIASQMNVEKFKASNSWLGKFTKRYICLRTNSESGTTFDHHYIKDVQDLIDDDNYSECMTHCYESNSNDDSELPLLCNQFTDEHVKEELVEEPDINDRLSDYDDVNSDACIPITESQASQRVNELLNYFMSRQDDCNEQIDQLFKIQLNIDKYEKSKKSL